MPEKNERDELIITMLEQVLNKLDKVNGRVRSLEVWRGSIVGAIGVIVFLLGWLRFG